MTALSTTLTGGLTTTQLAGITSTNRHALFDADRGLEFDAVGIVDDDAGSGAVDHGSAKLLDDAGDGSDVDAAGRTDGGVKRRSWPRPRLRR